jgi:hypothetical protein
MMKADELSTCEHGLCASEAAKMMKAGEHCTCEHEPYVSGAAIE